MELYHGAISGERPGAPGAAGEFTPKVAMVLGSGLGYLGDEVEDPIAVDYRDIPISRRPPPRATKGRLVFGLLEGPAGGCDAGPDAPL